MVETFKRLIREITLVTDESLILSLSVLSLVGLIAVAYWYYNRRRFHKLSHQIPASVLKSYLDSIIQNSTSLKSSLFRGGGLEIGGGIPSVLPTSELPQTTMGTDAGLNEALNAKNAEIASLNARLSEKDNVISDLENKITNTPSSEAPINNVEVEALQSQIQNLEEQLANSASNSGGEDPVVDNSEMEAKLSKITKERDELKERLMEYEVIEEDLANLKKLQQENEQLKKSLASVEAGNNSAEQVEVAAVEAPSAEPAAQSAEETVVQTAQDEQAEVQEPQAEVASESVVADSSSDEDIAPSEEGEQKSAEELLSEFEKMLG